MATKTKQPRARDDARDLGPWIDPIRQQGRDPQHRYRRDDWYPTPQRSDRSRRACRLRIYHQTYATSSGHTPDHHYENLAGIARALEDAGINLGWGGCADSVAGAARVSGSIEQDVRRRYADLWTMAAARRARR